MRTYGNDLLQQFQPKRLAILLGRPLTWMPHAQRLNRTKKLRKQSGKPRCRKT
jgi:hypothetical protein